MNQSLPESYKPATDVDNPHLCDLIETRYVNEMKSIKDLGDHVTNFCQMEAPEI